MVVINYGYVFSDVFDDNIMEQKKEATRGKWFDYVVTDDVIDSLKTILDKKEVDKNKLQQIVYDDVVNSRNVVFSSLSEQKAVEHANKLSEKCLVLKLQ